MVLFLVSGVGVLTLLRRRRSARLSNSQTGTRSGFAAVAAHISNGAQFFLNFAVEE